MKTRFFSLAAVLGAVGAAFCCLAPVIFSVLGVGAILSLTTLSYVAPYQNVFLAVTVLALAIAFGSVIRRRGRVARVEWAILGGSTLVVVTLIAYSVSVEGLPSLW